MKVGKRRRLSLAVMLGIVVTVGTGASVPRAHAEQPILIGMGVAQTGALAGGGKSALLALRMWVEDVNARGGLLGRKVELIAYDDQSNASTTPGIYAKLLDVDKVDLLIAPYGSVPTAPILPMVKQRNLLLMGNFSFGVNKIQHDMYFNNGPWRDAASWSEGFFRLGQAAGAKTVAFLVADQEFAQNLAGGAKEIAARHGLTTVYEQSYPPATVDFSSMIRAIRAAKPDIVYVMSYPNDSVAIVRAVNEIGVGDSVKIFGGAMVGLQFASIMESLGPMLNGIVNFNTYVPERTMEFPGVKDFLARYAAKAGEAKVDPLGYYLPPFNYAIGQMLEQAIKATKSLDHKVLADYLRKNEMKTIVGAIRFAKDGQWATPRLLMIQFRGVTEKNVEQFRQQGKQVILDPVQLKTGELIQPFDKARK
jgi:branched-chain amino acid transport system substrate-binding protein